MKIGLTLAFSALVLVALGSGAVRSQMSHQISGHFTGPSSLSVPYPDVGASTLAARAMEQQSGVGQFNVAYQFQFEDRIKESGITFVHRIVDDAGRFYKGVHYDHGTGIAVADVDGDGL